MRLKSATSFALVISLLFPVALFAANPKAGAKCPKAGQSQVFAGKKFTCIKSGKNLVWNKGVELPKPAVSPTPTSTPTPTPAVSPTPIPTVSPTATPKPTIANIDWSQTFNTDNGYLTPYNNPCERDPFIQPQWVELQDAYLKSANCIWPTALGKYELGKSRPKTEYLNANSLDIVQCKISEPEMYGSNRGFPLNWSNNRQNWREKSLIPGSRMTIQIVPIYAEDTAKPTNSPEFDYSRYTNFIKDWAEYSSDNGSNIQIKFPKEYIKIKGAVGDYGIYHENRHDSPGHVKFNKEVLEQVDPFIDFSEVNLAIFVVPAGTSLSVFKQGTIGQLQTHEGVVQVSTTEYPYSLEGYSLDKHSSMVLPYWWLHELGHSGVGIPDHYGDSQRNINTEYGMGWWSLMTPGGGDLTAWEKWFLGFYSDSQINCLNPLKESITWLAPSTVKTTEKKLNIIPFSKTKGIAIESVRSAGLYYKLPLSSNGVLIYEINLEISDQDQGLKLVLPSNRNPNQGPFFLAESTFRQGEFVVSNGIRITILESGTFGDVIKVEKA